MIQKISEVLTPKQLTVNSSFKKTLNNSKQLTVIERKQYLEKLPDVINPKFMGWYSKILKEIGKEQFMYLVTTARKGSDTPEKLLSWLLKQEMESNI